PRRPSRQWPRSEPRLFTRGKHRRNLVVEQSRRDTSSGTRTGSAASARGWAAGLTRDVHLMNATPRVGVVGAGRVGAVLSAALRAAGHDVVAAAGESDASRTRIEQLLAGVPVEKPTAVARACDLLLLTVP